MLYLSFFLFLFLYFTGVREFLLREACTLTTTDTDPQDGNRLKKVSAYNSIDSTKCSVLVEYDSR